VIRGAAFVGATPLRQLGAVIVYTQLEEIFTRT
jgi:hypothetical protein